MAIGHVRYSTSGSKAAWEATQPHISAIGEVLIALAHNGTLINTEKIRNNLVHQGIQMLSTTDSEVASKLIALETVKTNHLRDGIAATMKQIKGAYAMVLCTPDSLYAFRDPHGIRPLSLGKMDDGCWVVASETCAFDIIGAEFVRDVKPGEILKINKDGLDSRMGIDPKEHTMCVFEYVYFARPDSYIDGQNVYDARFRMGKTLAEECPVDADLVFGVPDSGLPGASGYSFESGLPYLNAIVKNRYVGRTFISPSQNMRQMGIRLKLNPLKPVLDGRRVVVIDDSIVRGNTMKGLIKLLREAGAKEVHLRILSPPVAWPCFYGIDMDTRKQLIAGNMAVEETRKWMNADSLGYISTEGLLKCMPKAAHQNFCTACFTGEYPIEIPNEIAKDSFKTIEDFDQVYKAKD